MNGMPIVKTMGRHAKLFATNSKKDRLLAIRLGFTAQGWASRALAAQRVLGESVGPEWTERITDVVLRASLLSPWTEAGRYGFQLEMLGHITGQAGKAFDELDNATRSTFERYGLTPEDWDIIRNTEQWKDPESGAQFIRAEDVAGKEYGTPQFDAANKLQQAIFSETDFAIVTATPRVRSVLTGGADAGTFWGEVMRNTALFKGFPITIIHQHFNRMMAQKGIYRKAEYAAFLMIGMTIMGMLGEQMNNIFTGKDPSTMDFSTEEGRNFFYKAVARGGSMGLLGDMIFTDANRWGGGLYSGLLGPVARQTEDAFKLTVGNVQQLAQDQETNAGAELSRFIQLNTPGRSLWYSKLAFERIMFDQMDHMLDPQSNRKFRKVEKRARKEFGQRYFWRPGKTAPARMPSLDKVFDK